MSLQYGKMEEKTHEEHGKYFAGYVDTSGYSGRFFAVSNARKEKDSQPDFIIKTPGSMGGREIGAFWEKTANKTGEVFYTLTLDGPDFKNPAHLAAFKDEKEDHFNIIFKRARRGGAPAKASSGDLNDDIPFN